MWSANETRALFAAVSAFGADVGTFKQMLVRSTEASTFRRNGRTFKQVEARWEELRNRVAMGETPEYIIASDQTELLLAAELAEQQLADETVAGDEALVEALMVEDSLAVPNPPTLEDDLPLAVVQDLSAVESRNHDLWAQCAACGKWRTQPEHVQASSLPAGWTCVDNVHDPERQSCDVPEATPVGLAEEDGILYRTFKMENDGTGKLALVVTGVAPMANARVLAGGMVLGIVHVLFPETGPALMADQISGDFAHLKDNKQVDSLLLLVAEVASSPMTVAWYRTTGETNSNWRKGLELLAEAAPQVKGRLSTVQDAFGSARSLAREVFDSPINVRCERHFMANAVAMSKDYDELLLRNLFRANNRAMFDEAVEQAQMRAPNMLAYVLQSEAEQALYTQEELEAYPHRHHMFSEYAIAEESKLIARNRPDGQGGLNLGANRRITSNNAEITNARDQLGPNIRSMTMLGLINGKAEQVNMIKTDIIRKLSATQSALTPAAEEVFKRENTLSMYVKHMEDLGNGVHTVAMPAYDPNLQSRYTVDILKRICELCNLPSLTNMPCRHFLCVLRHLKIDPLQIFTEYYPAYVRVAPILAALKSHDAKPYLIRLEDMPASAAEDVLGPEAKEVKVNKSTNKRRLSAIEKTANQHSRQARTMETKALKDAATAVRAKAKSDRKAKRFRQLAKKTGKNKIKRDKAAKSPRIKHI